MLKTPTPSVLFINLAKIDVFPVCIINAIELACSYDSRLTFYLYGSNQKVFTGSDRIHQLGLLTTAECALL